MFLPPARRLPAASLEYSSNFAWGDRKGLGIETTTRQKTPASIPRRWPHPWSAGLPSFPALRGWNMLPSRWQQSQGLRSKTQGSSQLGWRFRWGRVSWFPARSGRWLQFLPEYYQLRAAFALQRAPVSPDWAVLPHYKPSIEVQIKPIKTFLPVTWFAPFQFAPQYPRKAAIAIRNQS